MNSFGNIIKRIYSLYGKKLLMELIGYVLVALGTILFLYSDLGLNSWGIFHQGLSMQTILTFGQASQTFGFFLVIVCLFFKVIPGIGTILNMYFIGRFIDLIDSFSIIQTPHSLFLKFIMLFLGTFTMAYGMFFYLKENLGAGPKDGLMILLNKKSNLDIGIVRTGMELSAVIVGYLLGGKFGIGTIISALILGPLLRFIFKLNNYNPKVIVHENIIDTYHNIIGKGTH